MTISDRLAEIQARVEEATDGPWKVNGPDEDWAVVSSGSDSVFHAYSGHGICEGCECGDGAAHVAIGIEDAEFIAHARTDVPELVAAIRLVLNRHSEHVSAPGLCLWCEQPYPCSERRDIMSALGEVAP